LSVTDKSGLESLGKALVENGYELLASGGTARCLREAGLTVTEVADYTGQPEILQGRVKTLHPAIAAGILAKEEADLQNTGFATIDVVVVNLYDFQGATNRDASEEELVEAIDIGGPTLLRAAAKNFQRVTVLCDPASYPKFVQEMERHEGGSCLKFRRRMAERVFRLTTRYDEMIARELFAEGKLKENERALRYGENPHQRAWLSIGGGGDLHELGLTLHGGKELSYNNLVDLVAALKLAADLPDHACAILKHTNPCGVGLGDSPRLAFERALATDPVSAFGGIVVFRRAVDAEAAARLKEMFLEVVAAPSFDEEARELLAKKKNLRVLSVEFQRFGESSHGATRQWGRLVLRQEEDEGFPELQRWQHVAGPLPDDEMIAAARLAWIVAKHVKSNAIVLANSSGTLGVGAGQMSRVDSCHLAIRKAKDAQLTLAGCAAASDAFFPFPDGLTVLAQAGAATIVQPGGSIRDTEVVEVAQDLGVSLFHTAVRHFRH
jgi:phosphoribosylaminoimidazolecarboxamide formyltransferase/IMP cyclohydrolase